VCTIAWVVAFAWRRVGARAALLAGFVLATAIQFVVLGRSVRMDMLLTWVMTATLLRAYALATADDDARAPSAWPLYAFSAVGLLVKGPVAVVLPALIVITFLVVGRTRLPVRRLRPGRVGIAVVAVLAGLYLVLALRAPDYLWTFLFQHNVGRYVGRALAGHPEPFWYYFWILPVTFLPWTLFLPGALARARRRAARHDRLTIFLLVWCVVPFVFFTLARAKLATYLLPIFPPLALLVAIHVDVALRASAALSARIMRWPLAVWTAGMAFAAVGTPIGIAVAYPGYGMRAWPSALLAVFPLLGWSMLRRGHARLTPALVVAAALVTQVVFYRVGAPVVNEFSSLRAAAEIAADLPADAPVFAYKTRGHSFTYYGGRALLRVRSPEAVAEVLGRDVPTAALVKRRHLEKIRGHLREPVCIWWESPSGRALLANVPRPNHPAEARLVPASGLDATGTASGGGTPPC
jgi:4-amino-4-deoxy-L-arabinose transferase-like glycosyltransferase